MALLPIRRYGDPVLRRKARPVEQFDDDLQRLIRDMFQTMYAEPGVGLAAPQVGVSTRVVVIDVSPAGKKKEPMALINPRIVKTRGRISGEEGCLSFPGISVKIVRPEWVSVTAVNEKGLPVTVEGDGLLGRCLQHELDHLDGKMMIDRVSLNQKVRVWWEIRQLKKRGLWGS